MIRPVVQIDLTCETQGKFNILQFQLLRKQDMGSKPPLLSGSDCVRLGLVAIKGYTPGEDHHVNETSVSPSKSGVGATSLNPTSTIESDPPDKTDWLPPRSSGSTQSPAAVSASKTASSQRRTKPINQESKETNCQTYKTPVTQTKPHPLPQDEHNQNASQMPTSPGKLTKNIILEVFKDVHTGLGTLGPPLHIKMNPNVPPVQAHPHRCPIAKEKKAVEAIRDLERQGILKKVTEPTEWISNSERNQMAPCDSALIPARPSIRQLRSPNTQYPL